MATSGFALAQQTIGKIATWHLPTLRAWWATRPAPGWPRRKDTP